MKKEERNIQENIQKSNTPLQEQRGHVRPRSEHSSEAEKLPESDAQRAKLDLRGVRRPHSESDSSFADVTPGTSSSKPVFGNQRRKLRKFKQDVKEFNKAAETTECEDSDVSLSPIFMQMKEGGTLPLKDTELAAGYAITARHDTYLPPHSIVQVESGIGVEIPHGMLLSLQSRNALVRRGIATVPSTIVSGFCQHLQLSLFNCTDHNILVRRGERISLAVCLPTC